MQEVRPGFWVPAGTSAKWLFDGDASTSYGRTQIDACLAACKSRRTAVDGGAFVGTWSLRLAHHFRRVVAFEPVPANFECLRRNVKAVVEVHPHALTSTNGPMEYTVGAGGKPHSSRVQRSPTGQLAGFPLDWYGLTHVDLIKLDVEGHEYEALLGARKVITRNRPVIMIEERFDADVRATKLLQSWGMRGKRIKKHDYLFTWE